MKYEKALQFKERGSFFYEYPQKNFDPEERGIPHILSGSEPHLTEYRSQRVITYPESFAILVSVWTRMFSSETLALLSPLFFLIELGSFMWLARRYLGLSLGLTGLGAALLLFCTPHSTFNLQLNEVAVASSLILVIGVPFHEICRRAAIRPS